MRVSSDEMQNDIGKYIDMAVANEEVIITRDGKDAAKLVSCCEQCQGGIVSEVAAAYLPGGKPRVSYEEFLELTKDTDIRYELIDGEVFILDSPSYFHQVARDEIFVRFYNWFKGKSCRPVTSPFDVTLYMTADNINVVQPDILVICDTENINKAGRYKGVPVLVVEVLSESNRMHDILRKMNLYFHTGVREYWIVDPKKKEVHVHVFESGDIEDDSAYLGESVVESKAFKGLQIPLKEIFPEV